MQKVKKKMFALSTSGLVGEVPNPRNEHFTKKYILYFDALFKTHIYRKLNLDVISMYIRRNTNLYVRKTDFFIS